MRLPFLLTLTLLAVSSAFSQVHFRYGSIYKDEARAITATRDGGFALVGSTNGFGSAGNALLMKLNADGTLRWVKDYNGINPDQMHDVLETPSGELVMCGTTYSYGAGSYDAFVMKTDSLGNIIWVKAFGTIFGEQLLRIAADSAGGFYAAGYMDDYDSPTYLSGLLMRLDNSGNLTWSKVLPQRSVTYENTDLVTARNGDAVMVQTMGINIEFCIYRFANDGTLKWLNGRRPGSGAGGPLGCYLMENQFEELIVSFTTSNTITVAESQDVFFYNFDSLGNYLSSESVGGLYFDNVKGLRLTSDNKILVWGSTNSGGNGDYDAYLMKLNYDKTPIWARAYGDVWVDEALDAVENADGGFALAGVTFTTGSMFDSSKVLFIRTDSTADGGCRTKNWFPVRREQVGSAIFLSTPFDSTLVGNGITWLGTLRSLYEWDYCLVTATADAKEQTAPALAPNPWVDETLLLPGRAMRQARMSILDAQGRTVRRQEGLSGNSVTLIRQGLPAGLYHLLLEEEGHSRVTLPVLVQD